MTVQGDTSIIRTEVDERENLEEEFKVLQSDVKMGDNRLTQSEKIKSTKSKSTTYYNYLNNRMSVRIKYGGNTSGSASDKEKSKYGGGHNKALSKRLLADEDNE